MSDTAKEVKKKRKEQKQYKSKENEYNCNTNVKENDTIVIQTVNRNVNVIEDWFIDLNNGNSIVVISQNLNIPLETVKLKLQEFKKYAELEYPTYQKFVSHFKNWLRKNPTDPQKPKMVY